MGVGNFGGSGVEPHLLNVCALLDILTPESGSCVTGFAGLRRYYPL
ncbi:TPA: hypothetical protein ACHTI5_004811 [Salmonella enterica subsp. enterica serovar Bovismorbificans]|nr:hypothetical protein [Escherichia coli]EHU6147292.1 hypothetical protein [Escherichia coli]MCX8265674.1 hypothetical protein [Escherichia coli]HCN8438054.1 hypothetical protein [Escherichia coli]HCN8447176.1 hypothetical protein [Escherichia coli]HCN8456793.1 hypothetical protein [Escherichia coli]